MRRDATRDKIGPRRSFGIVPTIKRLSAPSNLPLCGGLRPALHKRGPEASPLQFFMPVLGNTRREAINQKQTASVGTVEGTTKTVKVRELIGLALDWAVANCLGWSGYETDEIDGKVFRISPQGFRCDWRVEDNSFCEDWALAGPVIAEKRVNLHFCRDLRDRNGLYIHAEMETHSFHGYWIGDHDKPLVATMRCFVASKQGEHIEVPVHLL